MAVKSLRRGHSSDWVIEYPALMEGDKIVVLMDKPRSGTVVHARGTSMYVVGDHKDDWVMGNLTPYRGEIILQNGD